MSKGRWLAPVVLMALAGSSPRAGADDQPSVDLRLPFAEESVRPTGLGGAFVGLADDPTTISINPAGLVTVPRSFEVLLAPAASKSPRIRLTNLGGGFRPCRWAAIGFELAQKGEAQVWPSTGAGLAADAPHYSSWTGTLGMAASLSNTREFSIGLSYSVDRLVQEGTKEDDWGGGLVAGLLFKPVNPASPRLGISYRQRTDWELRRGFGPVRIRTPAVLSAGASWFYDPVRALRVALTIQPDFVRYSQLTAGATGDARARDDVDLRFGLEASVPLQCWTGCGSLVQVRLGFVNGAPLPYQPREPRRGDATGQGPGRETSVSFGAAIALRRVGAGRYKLEFGRDGRTGTWLLGLGWRYPQSFRGEIESRR